MRYGIVIDLKRCLGCNSCTLACKQKNATPVGTGWAKLYQWESGIYPAARLNYLPTMCNHCAEPPCVTSCPTGASFQTAEGVVLVDPAQCIGCRQCMVACPYNARQFNFGQNPGYYPDMGPTAYEVTLEAKHREGTVDKCDLCLDRVQQGLLPACVQACPAGARSFGDLDDPNSQVSQLIAARGGYQLYPELGTDPSVYYLPG
jgi:molybdopterin-containing oxidoreductase family iron-sulfur binding subunit